MQQYTKRSRCKQPKGESFLLWIDMLLWRMRDTIQLQIGFLTDGSCPSSIHAGHRNGWWKVYRSFLGPQFQTSLQFIEQFAHNWLLQPIYD